VAAPLDSDAAQCLLALARQSLIGAAQGKIPDLNVGDLPPALSRPRGCFVTLTDHGALRGCVGHVVTKAPLYRAVVDNTHSAARRDPRFPPVRPDEVDTIRIEISVLTDPRRLQFASPEELLSQLTPFEDGVVLDMGCREATFLPQVWTHLPGKTEFLNQLALKAGCRASAWRDAQAAVSVYRVESFAEPSLMVT
jgi:AmmeMemoRadiSam system protein A